MADRATKPKVDSYGPVDVEVIGGVDGASSYLTKLEEASGTVTYVGKAAIGSSDAAAVWQIQKLETVGDLFSVSWAGGDALFDKVWNDRASLIYS